LEESWEVKSLRYQLEEVFMVQSGPVGCWEVLRVQSAEISQLGEAFKVQLGLGESWEVLKCQ
jgi:hypothetical protein